MKTELDDVKSTITITMGTKNRLRDLKGDRSYEEYIKQLIRRQHQAALRTENTIELQAFERRKATCRWGMGEIMKNAPDAYTILFSYNAYSDSPNFRFDIRIETVRDAALGRKILLSDFIKEISLMSDETQEAQKLRTQYLIYFRLLETAIRQAVDPQFRHKGRFEDYYLWKKEFGTLNLPESAFDEDVMEKLHDFKSGTGVFS